MARFSVDELAAMRALATQGPLGAWSTHQPSDYSDDDPVLEILASELHDLQIALLHAIDEIEALYAANTTP